jgi:2-C-methyl-D-erythritol 2,4-cyclodiphosphate synthase
MFRVGIGYDIHRMVEGRRLVLGGVNIPHSKGLLGHTDADVVLHAITDALLGAAGLPDIGDTFPDTDPAYKDADSRILFRKAVEKVREAGFEPGNVDVIVHAEEPKLSPYKQPMRRSVAELLGLAVERVNVKAKTNEGLGAVGRADAIACTAAVTLKNSRL